jgi:hypothetical protein
MPKGEPEALLRRLGEKTFHDTDPIRFVDIGEVLPLG